MKEFKKLLLEILDIINYTDDKDKYANDFLNLVSISALSDLVNTLPPDKKEEITAKLNENKDNQEGVSSIINEYFKEGDQIKQKLEKSAVSAIEKYIQSVGPTLSDEQLDNLEQLFESRFPQANAAI